MSVRNQIGKHFLNSLMNQGQRHGGGGGGKGGKSPPLRFQNREKLKNMGYFHASKLLKISFSVIFNEEILALEGLLSRF